jgi:hypothetical protein
VIAQTSCRVSLFFSCRFLEDKLRDFEDARLMLDHEQADLEKQVLLQLLWLAAETYGGVSR